MCAAIISGGDTPPVFEFTEHIFNFMALFVEGFVVFDLCLSIFLWRNTGLDAFVLQGFPEPIGIIPAIPEKAFGQW